MKTINKSNVITMENKLTEKELTSLQEAVQKVNGLQMQIGGLETQKHELLHAIGQAVQEMNTLQGELKETYGDVSIDINTGDIKEVEPNTED